MNDYLKEKLAILPDHHGCYFMKDRKGTIIYVGKAKLLKQRVVSYFTRGNDGNTQRLVPEIVDFDTSLTSSCIEGPVLE